MHTNAPIPRIIFPYIIPATLVTSNTVLDSMVVTLSTAPARRGWGAGVDPNPTYLPPWLGGSPSGLLAFSCERRGYHAHTGEIPKHMPTPPL